MANYKYKCDICGKIFTEVAQVIEHKKIHGFNFKICGENLFGWRDLENWLLQLLEEK